MPLLGHVPEVLLLALSGLGQVLGLVVVRADQELDVLQRHKALELRIRIADLVADGPHRRPCALLLTCLVLVLRPQDESCPLVETGVLGDLAPIGQQLGHHGVPRVVPPAHERRQPADARVTPGDHGHHDLEQQPLHVRPEDRHAGRCLRVVLRIVQGVDARATAALAALGTDGTEPGTVRQVHQLDAERRLAALGRDAAIRELGRKIVGDPPVADELRLQDLAGLLRVVDAARRVDERERRPCEHLQERRLPEAVALGEPSRRNGD